MHCLCDLPLRISVWVSWDPSINNSSLIVKVRGKVQGREADADKMPEVAMVEMHQEIALTVPMMRLHLRQLI